jgi:hypothetical protein
MTKGKTGKIHAWVAGWSGVMRPVRRWILIGWEEAAPLPLGRPPAAAPMDKTLDLPHLPHPSLLFFFTTFYQFIN